MENEVNTQNQGFHPVQEQLPYSVAVLVLGILSCVICWCWGLVGVALGIIAIVLSNKAKAIYLAYPGKYAESSFKNMKAGRICAIIGLCLSGLFFIWWICWVIFWGVAMSSLPWNTIFH